MNLVSPQKAIFMDRDGVINRKVDFLHRVEDMELLPGTAEAVAVINKAGYLAIAVTNQPVVVRNMCTLEELNGIHRKMEMLLEQDGARLDKIYFCPHHPDGENPAYRIACDCRKPAIGMILKAREEFNINLRDSFIIGDSYRDILCGRNAEMTTIGVRTGDGCRNSFVEPDFFFDDLFEAVRFILGNPLVDIVNAVESGLAASSRLPFVIAIGGNTRSGKTTLARWLARQLARSGRRSLVVSLDDWLLPRAKREQAADVLERFQVDKIARDLPALLHGRPVPVTRHNPLTGEKAPDKTSLRLADESVVIVEGVVALAVSSLRDIAHMKIF